MKANIFKWMCVSVVVLGLSLGGSMALAAEEGGSDPAGWGKGEKKGWEGNVPPGLAKKDVEKAEKEAKKKKREVEKATKKAKEAKIKAEKEAKKKQKEAEKASKKAKKSLAL